MDNGAPEEGRPIRIGEVAERKTPRQKPKRSRGRSTIRTKRSSIPEICRAHDEEYAEIPTPCPDPEIAHPEDGECPPTPKEYATESEHEPAEQNQDDKLDREKKASSPGGKATTGRGGIKCGATQERKPSAVGRCVHTRAKQKRRRPGQRRQYKPTS